MKTVAILMKDNPHCEATLVSRLKVSRGLATELFDHTYKRHFAGFPADAGELIVHYADSDFERERLVATLRELLGRM